jgi:hypothetical protein
LKSFKYLIFTQKEFDETSGGIVALYKLCHDLRLFGQEAYISHGPGNSSLNTPQFSPSIEELERDFIVIYPEVVLGNPLNCPRVVRWILNTPGAFGDTDYYKHEHKTDLVFLFSHHFLYSGIGKNKGILATTYTDFSIFKNYGLERSGSCYLVRKGVIREIIHDNDSLMIDNCSSWKAIAQIFNRKELLYCYDISTYWCTLAALCGCVALVIPDGLTNSKEWHKSIPYFDYGVAYGVDELSHARNTLDMVSDHIQNIEKKKLDSVRNFITITNNYYNCKITVIQLFIKQVISSPFQRIIARTKSDLDWWKRKLGIWSCKKYKDL